MPISHSITDKLFYCEVSSWRNNLPNRQVSFTIDIAPKTIQDQMQLHNLKCLEGIDTKKISLLNSQEWWSSMAKGMTWDGWGEKKNMIWEPYKETFKVRKSGQVTLISLTIDLVSHVISCIYVLTSCASNIKFNIFQPHLHQASHSPNDTKIKSSRWDLEASQGQQSWYEHLWDQFSMSNHFLEPTEDIMADPTGHNLLLT